VVEIIHIDLKGKPRLGDLSNRHELLLNGIKKGLEIDDYYFLVRDIVREFGENPRLIVRILMERKDALHIRRRRSYGENYPG